MSNPKIDLDLNDKLDREAVIGAFVRVHHRQPLDDWSDLIPWMLAGDLTKPLEAPKS